jgi:hypothetical protein
MGRLDRATHVGYEDMGERRQRRGKARLKAAIQCSPAHRERDQCQTDGTQREREPPALLPVRHPCS